MTLAEISLGAFGAFSGLRLVSYFPQIYRVARDANGASAISYSTWLMWTGSHLSTGCYAAINLGDRPARGLQRALCTLLHSGDRDDSHQAAPLLRSNDRCRGSCPSLSALLRQPTRAGKGALVVTEAYDSH